MATLPQAADLQRVRSPSETPGVRPPAIDYSPAAAGAKAIGQGIGVVGHALELAAKADEHLNDYDTQKKLLDFKLSSEMALEEYKRTMPAGGDGYAAGWQSQYRKMASAFVGKDDGNIPAQLRGKVGLALKHHEVMLGERAQRDEYAERDRSEVEGLETTLGTVRSRVEADPMRLDEMRGEGGKLIEASRLPPAMKDRLRKHFEKETEKTAILARGLKLDSAEAREALRTDLGPEMPDRRRSSVLSEGGKALAPAGWARTNETWKGLTATQKAAAMALMEADKADIDDARNALGAMINRAGKSGEDLGAHVSRSIYQPTIEPAQEGRLNRILQSPQFAELTAWADRRVKGEEADPVAGATHFLAPERTMLALESQNPSKYRSWRQWTGFDGREYRGVTMRDKSHAFLAPEGAAETTVVNDKDAYAGPYSNLTLMERKALWGQIDQVWRQRVADVDKEIKTLEGNAASGWTMPKPMLDDLARRVDGLKDPTVAAHFQSTLAQAHVVSAFQQRSPAENTAELNAMRAEFNRRQPTPEEAKALKHLEELTATQAGMVEHDKLTWANRSGTVALQQLDVSNPQSMATRLEQAVSSTQRFGGPIQYFTKPEREAMQAALKAGGDGLLTVAGSMAQAWGPEHTTKALKEISDKIPEAAIAGYLWANRLNPQAAQDIAATLKRRQDPNYHAELPPRHHAEAEAVAVLGDAYRAFPKEQRDAILKAADAIYENRNKTPDKKYTDDSTLKEIYKTAIAEVVGQRKDAAGKVYGGPVSAVRGMLWGEGSTKMFILPPTWRADTWRQTLDSATEQDFQAAGQSLPADASGERVSITKAIGKGKLVQVGPAQYAVAMGDPDKPGTEQWLRTYVERKPGKTDSTTPLNDSPGFILDLSKLEPVLRRRNPLAFWPGR